MFHEYISIRLKKEGRDDYTNSEYSTCDDRSRSEVFIFLYKIFIFSITVILLSIKVLIILIISFWSSTIIQSLFEVARKIYIVEKRGSLDTNLSYVGAYPHPLIQFISFYLFIY